MTSPEADIVDNQPPAGETPTSPPPGRPPARRRRSLWSPGVIVAVAIVAALGVVTGRQLVTSFGPHLYSGTVLQDDTPAPPMDGLTFARSGEAVDLATHRDKVVIVFFGYTSCPDVCPASMALAARAMTGMSEEDQARTEVWMVSVDPGRDAPDSLQEYVEFFDPTFEGISGTTADIDRVTTGYGVFYELEPTATEGANDYLVDHTASLFGIGPDGSLRIVWPPTVTAEELQADIEDLL